MNTVTKKFGYEGALYLHNPLGDYQRNLENRNKIESIIRLIGKYNSSAKFIVENVKKRYNATITDLLKEVTGLKLRHKESHQYSKVSIDIVTSIPPALLDILINTDEVIIELILKLGSLNDTSETLNFFELNYSKIISELIPDHTTTARTEITSSKEFTNKVISALENSNLYKSLKSLSMDNLLGAYFYNKGKVELYWPALAFYSNWKRMPLFDLAFIVLTHEKAHVITHCGYDLDGNNWSTIDFDQSDISIVEGLAQFYTDQVCRNFESSVTITRTFDRMLEDDSAEYTCFKKWLLGEKGREEKVRLTMLNTRKSRIIEYDLFLKELNISAGSVKSKKIN